MKYSILIITMVLAFASCKSRDTTVTNSKVSELDQAKASDTVRIANDELEYEIVIIEPGFNAWLVSRARPEGYYSQQFLESRNQLYVIAWNERAMQPTRYGNLYEWPINYQPQIDYGYDVNYQLYNYFIFFQLKYNQRLTGFVPRI